MLKLSRRITAMGFRALSSAATTKICRSRVVAAARRRYGVPLSKSGGMKWRRVMCIPAPNFAEHVGVVSRPDVPKPGAFISKELHAREHATPDNALEQT